ncbi:MAG: hypothetical protein ACRD10_14255 [Terriglobia bacterium]
MTDSILWTITPGIALELAASAQDVDRDSDYLGWWLGCNYQALS